MAFISRSKSNAATVPEVKPEPKHANILQADPFAYKTAHRRMAWLLRLSVGTNVALAICVVARIQALVSLVPLKQTEIALLRADPGDDRGARYGGGRNAQRLRDILDLRPPVHARSPRPRP